MCETTFSSLKTHFEFVRSKRFDMVKEIEWIVIVYNLMGAFE